MRRVARVAAALAAVSALAGCSPDGERNAPDSFVARQPAQAARLGTIGRAATAEEVQAWDIDVNPTGRGLPPGSGTPASGAKVFAAKCAACHGARGEGAAIYPKLIGREPRSGFPFGTDARLVKTVGNYWPYSTTLFDYIRRAMPLSAPGSLSTNEVYDLVAFLLAENEIIPRDRAIDARSLPAIRMPARDHFVPDNRTGGATFR